MGNCIYLPGPGSLFAEIRRQVTHVIVPERVFWNSATFTIPFTIDNALEPLVELLYADQVRNVHFSRIGVPSIQRGFKIVEYVQYSVACGNMFFNGCI